MVVRYEDLKKDYLTEVMRMLDFLNQSYSRAELKVKLKGGFVDFWRNHTAQYEHYTKEQETRINTLILQTLDILKGHRLDHLYQLRDYLKL